VPFPIQTFITQASTAPCCLVAFSAHNNGRCSEHQYRRIYMVTNPVFLNTASLSFFLSVYFPSLFLSLYIPLFVPPMPSSFLSFFLSFCFVISLFSPFCSFLILHLFLLTLLSPSFAFVLYFLLSVFLCKCNASKGERNHLRNFCIPFKKLLQCLTKRQTPPTMHLHLQ
jgi:hypothetical protein